MQGRAGLLVAICLLATHIAAYAWGATTGDAAQTAAPVEHGTVRPIGVLVLEASPEVIGGLTVPNAERALHPRDWILLRDRRVVAVAEPDIALGGLVLLAPSAGDERLLTMSSSGAVIRLTDPSGEGIPPHVVVSLDERALRLHFRGTSCDFALGETSNGSELVTSAVFESPIVVRVSTCIEGTLTFTWEPRWELLPVFRTG